MTFEDRHNRPRLGTSFAANIKSMIDSDKIIAVMSGMVQPVTIYGDEGDTYIYMQTFDYTAETSMPANSNAEIFCTPIPDEQSNHVVFGTWRVAGDTMSHHLLLHPMPGKPWISGMRKVAGNLKGVVHNNTNQTIEVTLCYA